MIEDCDDVIVQFPCFFVRANPSRRRDVLRILRLVCVGLGLLNSNRDVKRSCVGKCSGVGEFGQGRSL